MAYKGVTREKVRGQVVGVVVVSVCDGGGCIISRHRGLLVAV